MVVVVLDYRQEEEEEAVVPGCPWAVVAAVSGCQVVEAVIVSERDAFGAHRRRRRWRRYDVSLAQQR